MATYMLTIVRCLLIFALLSAPQVVIAQELPEEAGTEAIGAGAVEGAEGTVLGVVQRGTEGAIEQIFGAGGAAEAGEAADVYAEFGQANGLSDNIIAELRGSNVDLGRVQGLVDRGMDPAQAARVGINGSDSLDISEALLDRGFDPQAAGGIANRAAQVNEMDAVSTLASDSNFRNPDVLTKVLNSIRDGSRGLSKALEDAAARVRAGDEVELENGQADIVDFTRREAVQSKEVVAPADPAAGNGRNALFRNLNEAATQLRGESGEVPPEGFARIGDISITNPANFFYSADRQALGEAIQSTQGLEGVDEFRITNGLGTEIFRGPDFAP